MRRSVEQIMVASNFGGTNHGCIKLLGRGVDENSVELEPNKKKKDQNISALYDFTVQWVHGGRRSSRQQGLELTDLYRGKNVSGRFLSITVH